MIEWILIFCASVAMGASLCGACQAMTNHPRSVSWCVVFVAVLVLTVMLGCRLMVDFLEATR
jgi:hypothetical protein